MKRLVLALGVATGLLALGAPAAQASTHTAASGPARVVAPASTPKVISNVASNGNGLPYTIGSCNLVVGDHALPGGQASGEADIKCPSGENYSLKVYLDYRFTPNGKLYTGAENSDSWYGSGGRYWDLWTTGLCHTGGAATYYWTTYAEISFNGGPWYGWYTSRQNVPYTIPAC